MPCEICKAATSEPRSAVPADGEYFVAVFEDDEAPDGALPKIRYEFCSVRHLRAFVPSPDADQT